MIILSCYMMKRRSPMNLIIIFVMSVKIFRIDKNNSKLIFIKSDHEDFNKSSFILGFIIFISLFTLRN